MSDPEPISDAEPGEEASGGTGRSVSAPPLRPAKVLGLMLIAIVVGVPLVAYLWETVHQILALEVDTTRLLVSIPLAALLVFLLRLLGRSLWSVAG